MGGDRKVSGLIRASTQDSVLNRQRTQYRGIEMISGG